LVLVTLVAVAIYTVFVLASDVRALRALLSHFQWSSFAIALLLAMGNYLLRFAKWQYYLRSLQIGCTSAPEAFTPIPWVESLMIFLAGFSMSLTPGKAGEVFRSALLLSARGTPVARSAPIVIADRVTDLLALVLLVGIGSLQFAGYAWIAAIATLMVAVVIAFVFVRPFAELLFRVLDRIPVLSKLGPKIREAYAALQTVMSPKAVVMMTALSVLAWGLECLGLWAILQGLQHPAPVALAFFVYATSTIAGALAMLPGGLGGTEVVMRTMLVALGGLPVAPAAAATLLVRLATLWFAIVVGFAALAVVRLNFDRASKAPSAVRPAGS
jgi:uncharacterized protein (TIRG00374 family)